MNDLRLIVALAVSDGLLAMSSICQREANVGHVPGIILHFLQYLDPHIGDGHCQSVVESNAS